jgi:hypothetical protein
LASSDGVQVHNTDNIRLLLEGGEDQRGPWSFHPQQFLWASAPFNLTWQMLEAACHLLF